MEVYTIDKHNIAVHKLAREVSHFHANQIPFRINHGSTNSTRGRDPATPQLAIAHLDNIIDIDEENSIALVEPNVPLDKIVEKSLRKGLMPPVVPEFPGEKSCCDCHSMGAKLSARYHCRWRILWCKRREYWLEGRAVRLQY